MSKPKKKPIKFKTPFRGKIQYRGADMTKTAKPDKIVSPKEFALKQERDERIERERALEQGAVIYHKWRRIFLAKRRTLEDVIGEIDDLRKQLETIQSEGINFVVGNILNPILTQLAEKVVFSSFAEKVVVSCPHQTIKNGSKADCGWGGFAMFHKEQWRQKKAAMSCPQCGGDIAQDGEHMMIEAEARKALAELKKGKEKK